MNVMRLGLLTALRCLGAGDGEIEGWKVIGLTQWANDGKGCLTPSGNQAMIRSVEPLGDKAKLKVAIDLQSIDMPEHFRCGVFLGQSEDEWAGGRRLEIVFTSSDLRIVQMDYAGSQTPASLLEKKPAKVRANSAIRLEVNVVSMKKGSLVAVRSGSVTVKAKLDYPVSEGGWGFIVNRGKATFRAE